VIQIALGDIQIEKSSPAEPVGYVGRASEKWSPEQLREVGQVLASRFPTRWPQVDYELARTLAMFECDDARLPERFSQCWNEESLPAGDLHYLFALSRLAAPRCNEVTHRTAAALLALHRKLRLREELVSRFWPDRVMELTAGLCRRDPALPAAIVDAPAFELMDNALFTVGFEPPLQQRAARRLLAVLQRSDSDDAPRYSDELIRLVASLPIEESLPVLRRLWDEQGASRRISIELAARAELADRNRLIAGLAMLDDDAVAQCARALARLSGDESNDDLTAAARALGRYCDVRPLGSPKENQGFRWPQTEVRQALLALFEGRSGRQFLVDESSATDLRLAYRPVFEWLKQDLPEAYAQIGLSSSATDWLSKLSQIDWSAGNAQRGQVVFEKQSCHRCHGEVQRAGNQRLGPDLAGAAERFSRDDLFVAIVNPSASVAPAYRTTQLATRDGRAFHGLIVYESPDGTLLQTGPDTIIRVTGEELLWMEPGDRSLMPDGLLNGLADGEIADLYAYLKTLQAAR
jgi:putative heme-binding domain-containing protein